MTFMNKVRILFPDMNGCLRGKIVPEEQFNNAPVVRVPRSVLSQDIEGEESDALEEFSPRYHDRDLIVAVDESTKYTAPHQPSTINYMANAQEQDGKNHPVAPRSILQQAITALQDLGYTMRCSAEIEFYLTDKEGRLMTYSEYDLPFGDVNSLTALEAYITDLEAATNAIGLKTESILNEAGAGQLEITYNAQDPLSTADKISFFKLAAREVARKHGMGVSFLAKPDVHNVSSSQHIHFSLWSGETQVSASDGVLRESMLASLILRAHESFALYCPNPNSFRRYSLGKTYIASKPDWGEDNRRVSFRIAGNGDNVHIENRIPGADANIYLVLSCIIYACIEGIQNKLTLEDKGVAKAMKQTFPESLPHALQLFTKSDFIKNNLGEDFAILYDGIKHQEFVRFSEQITDWERKTFGRQV